MQNLKNYNNEEFWNSLNLTWTKYFINFHHFENSSNYYTNNGIHIKVFKFPQKITFAPNILPSKTLLKFWFINTLLVSKKSKSIITR